MAGCEHTREEHEAMKRDGVWETLPFAFYAPADEHGGPDEEARDAPCGSTLQRPCVLTEEERIRARRDNKARREKVIADIRAAFEAKGLKLPPSMMVAA